MTNKTVVFLVFAMLPATGADRLLPKVPKAPKEIYRQGINVTALRMAATRDALRALAGHVEMGRAETSKIAPEIESYLSFVPSDAVCIESLTTIVCVLAQQGDADILQQLFDAIRRRNDDVLNFSMYDIVGTALVAMKKEEYKNKFSSKNKIPSPGVDKSRKILEEQFRWTKAQNVTANERR